MLTSRPAATAWPSLSVVIPAFNEERYLTRTIEHLRAAEAFLQSHTDAALQILVVDNNSTDRTAQLARDLGLAVVRESEHNIGKVRNTGARAALYDVLVFLDADTLVPRELLLRIAQLMRGAQCAGGAVKVAFRPRRLAVRAYLDFMWFVGRLAGMELGACQFCERGMFTSLGGYDEKIYMGEDVDFVWRLRAAARLRGFTTSVIRDMQVVSSSRRFDTWSLWRILLTTNPALVFGLRRRKSVWRGWYDESVAPR